MAEELKPDSITRITCEYDGQPIKTALTNNVAKGEYHYDLYLPAGYGQDKTEVYPCLFIADSVGNAQLRNMSDRVKRDRMIAVMLVESKNGDLEPSFANFCAAHDDAIKRVRIGFKWMTGISGAARVTSLCVQLRPGFTGMLLQSAGFGGLCSYVKQFPLLGVYATFGRTDFNLEEAGMMARDLPPQTPYDYAVFGGGHEWAPVRQVDDAFDWLERWTYFVVPAQSGGKPAYLHYFKLLSERIDQAQDDFGKYELSDRAVRFAISHKLSGERTLADRIKILRTNVAALAKDSAVKHELAARDAYEKVLSAEESARRRASTNAGQLKAMLKEAVVAFGAVGTKYPGTRYADKAGQAVERLNVELN